MVVYIIETVMLMLAVGALMLFLSRRRRRVANR